VPASGAFGALDYERTGDEPDADAFVDLVAGDDFRFHLNQTNPAPNRARATLDLAATNENDGLRVVPDERNGTLFVAMRTDRLSLDRGQRDGLRVDSGDRYEANFTIAESAGLSDGRRTALGSVAFVERSASFETAADGSLQLDLGLRCNAVAGESSVAPGTDLTVRLRGTDGAFSLTREVTVDRNGTFRAIVENISRPASLSFTATVRGFPDSETPGVVGFGRSLTTVSLSAQSTDGRTVTVDSVSPFEPGFVALYPADSAPDRVASAGGCPVELDRDRAADALGVSERLPAEPSTDVSVRLDEPLTESRRLVAVPFLDTNENGRFDPRTDEPVFVNGTLVAAGADVTVSPATGTTPGPTTTGPTTDSPTTVTTSPTPHPPDTPEPGTTTPTATTTADGPGFGALVALLALLALTALAAVRRP
jgi:PGF-CTERM protein